MKALEELVCEVEKRYGKKLNSDERELVIRTIKEQMESNPYAPIKKI